LCGTTKSLHSFQLGFHSFQNPKPIINPLTQKMFQVYNKRVSWKVVHRNREPQERNTKKIERKGARWTRATISKPTTIQSSSKWKCSKCNLTFSIFQTILLLSSQLKNVTKSSFDLPDGWIDGWMNGWIHCILLLHCSIWSSTLTYIPC
jgi:hypothetical protein